MSEGPRSSFRVNSICLVFTAANVLAEIVYLFIRSKLYLFPRLVSERAEFGHTPLKIFLVYKLLNVQVVY